MERTIYERADGDAAARLSAPAASQRADCSSVLSRGFLCLNGRTGAARLCAGGWRWLVLDGVVCAIDTGPKEGLLCRLMA